MSRLDELEADKWAVDRGDLAIGRFRLQCTSPNDIAKWHNDKARTLAAEVDELRAELKVVREGKTELNGIMEAMTKGAQAAAEVDARDEVITKLLALVKPEMIYRRACEIAGRTE